MFAYLLIFVAMLGTAAALGLDSAARWVTALFGLAALAGLAFLPGEAPVRSYRLRTKWLWWTGGGLVLLGQLGWALGAAFKAPEGLVVGVSVVCLLGLLVLLAGLLLPEEGVNLSGQSLGPAAGVAAMVAAYGAWSARFIYMSSTERPLGTGRAFCLFDDAMVSLRYAWNLAHGKGLVWNPGERIEGYTNMLQTLLMSIGCRFLDIFHAALFTQVLGVLTVLGAALAVMKLFFHVSSVKEAWLRRPLSLLAFAFILWYYPLSFWSLMGMETGLSAVFLLWSLALALEPAQPRSASPALALCLAGAVLTRPDAILFAGIILGAHSLRLARGRAWGAVLKQAFVFALLPAAGMAFRVYYYGDVVPNTYYLKLTGLDRDIRLSSGWAYVRQFLVSVMPLLWLAVAGLILRPNLKKALLAAVFMAAVGYQVWIGGDAWLYWRFLAPFVPIPLLLCVEGAALAACLVGERLTAIKAQSGSHAGKRSRALPAAPSQRLVPVAVAAFFAGSALLLAERAFFKELTLRERPFSSDYNAINVGIGTHLKKLLKPGGSVGVTWAGTIPYFSEMIGIDFLGKCDKYIASRRAEMVGFNGMATVPGHNKYDLHYSIEKLKPDYIQTDFWAGDDLAPYAKIHYTRVDNLLLLNDSAPVNWAQIRAEKLVP